MTRYLASTSRGPRAPRVRLAGWAVLATLVLGALAVLLGGRGGFSLWNDAVIEDGGHVATGVVDIVSTGTPVYQVGAAAFDPVTDRLIAGQTLTITVPTTVRVSGTTADPSLSLPSLALPAGLAGKATISSSATAVTVADSDQAATITITLVANVGASYSGEVVDLSAVLLHLASGTSWQDDAALGLANVTMNDLPEMDITYAPSLPGATSSIKVPISGRTGKMLIDWGDGTIEPITADFPTHTYSAGGPYSARVYGRFTSYGSGDAGVVASNKSVASVDRWDANGVTNLSRSFQGANNLVSVVAPPNTITDLSYAFFQNTGFNGSLAGWDTGNVKKMFATFNGATAYNQPLTDWDTGSVTDMAQMFMNSNYNADIAGWNTQSVKDMGEMFHNNKKFNQPIGGWATSSLTGINGMFQSATAFNQPLAGWNTSTVSNMYMAFNGASSFDQPIGNWDTSKATNMAYMFLNSGMTQDLSAWTVDLIPSMPVSWSPPSFPQVKWPLPWQSQMQITYDTTLPGVSSTSVIVPISGRSGLMMINWGDDTPVEKITADLPTHTYAANGTYTAKIFGTFSQYGSSDAAVRNSNKAIQSVGRWDANGVTSLSSAFSGANNLTSVVEPPHTVTDMAQMFENAWVYNQDISAWDVSRIQSFDRMFGYAFAFNQPIGLWDTSGATSMQRVFWHASVFNQPLAHWNTAGVTNMYQMFNGATKFNQPIGNWDTSKVANMTDLFNGASAMTADLSTWTVDLIPSMPSGWKPTAGYPIAKWPLPWQGYTMLVTYDTGLAGATTTIELPISGRNGLVMVNWGDGTPTETLSADLPTHTYSSAASRQVRIYGQFATYGSADAGVLASNPGVKSVDQWDANGVTSVADAFLGASHLTAVVEPPHTVTDMSGMFEGAGAFNQDISGWNTAAVTNMSRMFADAAAFDQPLGAWNTTVVTDMTGMFSGASAMAADLSAWTVDLIATMPANWKPTAGYPEVKWPLPWQHQMVIIYDTTMSGATTSIKVPISGRTGSMVIDWGDGVRETVTTDNPTHVYAPGQWKARVVGYFTHYGSTDGPVLTSNKSVQSVDRWDDNGVTSVRYGFNLATNLVSIAEPPHTVTDMSYLFEGATNFNQNIGGWNTSNVTNMEHLFGYAKFFNQNISSWNTSKVTNMNSMFWHAEAFNQPIGGWGTSNGWDTSNVTNMANLFWDAHAFNQPLDEWNTSKVTNMGNMFQAARLFNQPLGTWDTSKVTNMAGMFQAANLFNQPIGTWNTSKVASMTSMFLNANAMNADLSAWTVDKIATMPSDWKPSAGYPMAKWPLPWQSYTMLVTYDTGLAGATTTIELPISGRNGLVMVNWGDGAPTETLTADLPTHTYASAASRQIRIYGQFATYGSADAAVVASNQALTTVDRWDANGVTSLAHAFEGATNLTSVVEPPHTVTNMSSMFEGASAFNQDISGWNTAAVTDMNRMFADASDFDQPLGAWNTTVVTDMTGMFSGASAMAADLSAWTVDLIPDMPTDWNPPNLAEYKWPLPWQRPMLINLDTAMPGATTNIKLPISGRSGDVYVNWGDGSPVATLAADYPTHTYGVGVYQAKVYGQFSQYGVTVLATYLDGAGDATLAASNKSLKSIQSWGRANPTSLSLAFVQANNLSSLPSLPASVTDLSWAFHQNSGFTAPITGWDTSNVTSLRGTFNGASNFNQAIGDWNTSKVTDLYWTFRLAKAFNQPLNDWDTSNVTDMGNVFNAAYAFNQPLDNWKTGKVTNMAAAFFNAWAFNRPLATWDVSQVTDASQMFQIAKVFNQDISGWKTVKVTNMHHMFDSATAFNQPIGGWDTSQVTDMTNMFNGASAMTADLSAWTVDLIPFMPANWKPSAGYPMAKWPLPWQPTLLTYDTTMVGATTAITVPISGLVGPVKIDWDDGSAVETVAADLPTHTYAVGSIRQAKIFGKYTTFGSGDAAVLDANMSLRSVDHWSYSVTSLSSAFRAANNLVSIATPPTTVTDLSYAFADNTTFNASIDGWDVSNVTNLKGMFSGASVFNQPLESWTTSNVTDMASLFEGAHAFNQPLNGWQTGNVTSMASMFADAGAFDQVLDQWDTSKVTDMTSMFAGQTVMSQDLSAWTVELVATMPADWSPPAFPDTKWPLPWQPTRLTYDTTMPSATKSIKVPISDLTGTVQIDWGDNSGIQTIVADLPTHTYAGGTYEAKIYGSFKHYGSDDAAVLTSNKSLKAVTHWSRNGMTNMYRAFRQADNLTSVAPPPSSVTNMSYTFYQNAGFNGPVNDWDTSNVTNMESMFDTASSFNQPLNKWDTSKVTDMQWMFVRATVFNQDISGWDTSQVTTTGWMFHKASAFNQPIGGWNTANVVQMSGMFTEASAFNQPLDKWKTANVTGMTDMFNAANAMTADLHTWTVDKIATMPSGWSPPNYPQEKWPQRWQPVAPTGVMVRPALAPTPSESATLAPTPTPTPTPSLTPTPSASAAFGPTPTPTPTPSFTPTPSESAAFGPTPTPTPAPSVTPTPSLDPSVTATPSDSATASPAPTPDPQSTEI